MYSKKSSYPDSINIKKWLFLVLILAAGCQSNKVKQLGEAYNPIAVELNEKAMNLPGISQDSALLLLDEAIKADSSYHIPHMNKAGIYIQRQDLGSACDEINIALAKKPDYADGWFLGGILYAFQSDTIRAVPYFQKCIEYIPREIRETDDQSKKDALSYNLAIAKVFVGDDAYLSDFEALKNTEEFSDVMDHYDGKTREEIIAEFGENGKNMNAKDSQPN